MAAHCDAPLVLSAWADSTNGCENGDQAPPGASSAVSRHRTILRFSGRGRSARTGIALKGGSDAWP